MADLDLLGTHRPAIMPQSNLGEFAFWVGDDLPINFFVRVDARYPELHALEGYLSVGVGSPPVSQTEDIAGRFIRKGNFEGTKQRLPLAKGCFKTHTMGISPVVLWICSLIVPSPFMITDGGVLSHVRF